MCSSRYEARYRTKMVRHLQHAKQELLMHGACVESNRTRPLARPRVVMHRLAIVDRATVLLSVTVLPSKQCAPNLDSRPWGFGEACAIGHETVARFEIGGG